MRRYQRESFEQDYSTLPAHLEERLSVAWSSHPGKSRRKTYLPQRVQSIRECGLIFEIDHHLSSSLLGDFGSGRVDQGEQILISFCVESEGNVILVDEY